MLYAQMGAKTVRAKSAENLFQKIIRESISKKSLSKKLNNPLKKIPQKLHGDYENLFRAVPRDPAG